MSSCASSEEEGAYDDGCQCSSSSECLSGVCSYSQCISDCGLSADAGDYDNGCFCSYDEECKSGNCSNNSCSSSFPWWAYVIIFGGVAVIAAAVAVVIFMGKGSTSAGAG
mmetsp:Transcript_21745/g.16078  ORF Transcript_21745/g.16078 Transcript_21745/m.16078 type:complete len:110 (-) Transcript_21745:119-448(-)